MAVDSGARSSDPNWAELWYVDDSGMDRASDGTVEWIVQGNKPN